MEMWRASLATGNTVEAWDLFIARYRRLVVAVIKRTVTDADDVADVFAEVCADLSSNDLALLNRHDDSNAARFSTWLVTVVHHRTIDWVRHRDGRRRVKTPTGLSTIQREIFDCIVIERQSHVEAYELMRQRLGFEQSFAAFMREVTATFHALDQTHGKTVAHYFPGPPPPLEQEAPHPHDALVLSESAHRVAGAMQALSGADRLAVQLFVVEELPAADVAKLVGWPNAKAVYNRVYRALDLLRLELERLGVGVDGD